MIEVDFRGNEPAVIFRTKNLVSLGKGKGEVKPSGNNGPVQRGGMYASIFE